MKKLSEFNHLSLFKLIFLLGVPACGVLFWLGGGLLTERILSRPYGTLDKLQVEPASSDTLAVTFIQAKILKSQNYTTVIARMNNGLTHYVEFELPFTETSELEKAIAHRLNLSLSEVRSLVRYQIV